MKRAGYIQPTPETARLWIDLAEAIAWIDICYDKGFMVPISLQGGVTEGEVFYNGHQLIEMVGGKWAQPMSFYASRY